MWVETGRVALIHYTAPDGTQCVGSGLLIDERRVLTADHVAEGSGHRVECDRGRSTVGEILRSGTPEVDLAVLTLSEPVGDLARLGCARVDRSRVDRVSGCAAVGFPRWKKDGDRRRSAQVGGWLPTAEGLESIADSGLRAGWLTLVGDRIPGAPEIPVGTLSETAPSPWGGMSGAAVVAGKLVVGVVRSHNLAAGGQSLTVTPVTAVDQLPDQTRQRFWSALGVVNPEDLVVLPMAPAWQQRRRPIWELSALDLGVHQAITVSEPAGIPPVYVSRDHDAQIDRLLSGIPSCRMLVLVGDSCTGKTRAAYEAIRRCPHLHNWSIVSPEGPEALLTLLGQEIPTRTFLWLDDIYLRYLTQTEGSRIAERLLRALQTADKAIKVVSTMWAEQWRELTEPLTRPESAWRACASSLLRDRSVCRIDVPPQFDADSAELYDAAARDDRIMVALEAAGPNMRVTQVLAGGEPLLTWYQTGLGAQSRALITAALDAARIGCSGPIPISILLDAAAWYLTDEQRVAGGDWPSVAVDQACAEIFGIRALNPRRVAPGIGPPDSVLPHDYLLQHAIRNRDHETVSPAIWDGLVRSPASPDDSRLALEARKRGYYGHSAILSNRAAGAGDVTPKQELASIMAKVSYFSNMDADAFRELTRKGTITVDGMEQFLYALEHEGCIEEALALVKGRQFGQLDLIDMLERLGRRREAADTLFEVFHERGLLGLELAYALVRWSLAEERLPYIWSKAETGDVHWMVLLVRILWLLDRDEEAVVWQQRVREDWADDINQLENEVDSDDTFSAGILAHNLQDTGRGREAIARYQDAINSGSRFDIKNLIQLLERMGRIEDAIAWHRRSLELGDDQGWVTTFCYPDGSSTQQGDGELGGTGIREYSRFLTRHGRHQEAQSVRLYGIEPGGATAAPWESLRAELMTGTINPGSLRSLERIDRHDLLRLAELAAQAEASLFERNPTGAGRYADRLLCRALCQGAALHYVDARNGVKDFDVWSFYAERDDGPFPYRWRGTADYGPSKFGRYPGDPPSYTGRRVDFLGRSLRTSLDTDPFAAVRDYLAARRTASARELADKAVVLIYPRELIGKVIWPETNP